MYVTATGDSNARMAYLGVGVVVEGTASMGLCHFLGQHCGPIGRVINLCLGTPTGNIYTQPGARKLSWASCLSYTGLWIAVIMLKLLVGFFFVIQPVVKLQQQLFSNTTYYADLIVRDSTLDSETSHSMLADLSATCLVVLCLTGPLWVNAILFYVIDLEVYFVFALNIVSAFRGIWIGVGSRLPAVTVEADLGLLSGLPSKLKVPRGADAHPSRSGHSEELGSTPVDTTNPNLPWMGPGTILGNSIPWANLWNEVIMKPLSTTASTVKILSNITTTISTIPRLFPR